MNIDINYSNKTYFHHSLYSDSMFFYSNHLMNQYSLVLYTKIPFNIFENENF